MERELGKIEGILNQMNERLNHVETMLQTKADKRGVDILRWEIRLWFLVLILLITIFPFLK